MNFKTHRRSLSLAAVLLPLLALFFYVALRSGPLAPVPVTLTTVEDQALSPALFGIGTVEARYTYKIGPTQPGRIKQLLVQVGDRVRAGQVLGEMDPVDLNARLAAQNAALKAAQARLREAKARLDFARSQASRYRRLLQAKSTSEEIADGKQQEALLAEAGFNAAEEELSRLRAERDALLAQAQNLQFVAPVDGLVTRRDADPGTTVVAGQAVIELVDPDSLWVNVRFDQIHSTGLSSQLPAKIELRTRAGVKYNGQVLRIEPVADAVTEEILAKIVFESVPEPMPPIGQLAEVTVDLPALPSGPVIPNAAIQVNDGLTGVWLWQHDELQFTAIETGASSLDGMVQVLSGLQAGDRIVVYSEKSLHAGSRIQVVDKLAGAPS